MNHTRLTFPLFALLILSGLLWPDTRLCAQSAKPNILLILADDLGYGDLPCYNPQSQVPTPNLDRLAAGGIRFSDAYCPVAVCSPTRYSLMTGRYSWKSWKPSGVMANYEPSMIEEGRLTLPRLLQESGYVTAGLGKWHLGATFPTLDGQPPAGYGKFRADNNGANLDLTQPVRGGPLSHGFDSWHGFSCASECWILTDNQITGAIGHDLYTIDSAKNAEHIKRVPLADFLPDITQKGLDFLEEQAAKPDGKPFFLYFAPYVPHIPLAVSPAYRGRTEAGLYGDYVHELDHYLGQLLDALDRLGLSENTLVLFASDNGSQFLSTSRNQDAAQASNSLADVQAADPTAHRPNSPLRGTKWTVWEGGVRTPFLARWPGHIPAGKVSNELFALNDLLATIAALTGYELPADAGEDSFNLLPALLGGKGTRKSVVVQASGKVWGLRSGKWKFIGEGNYKPAQPGDPPGELYDLKADPAESTNLYEKKPKVAARMRKQLQQLLAAPRSARP